MSTKIGGIYVEVRADKTQFQNDLSAIRSEAKKSGSDIGKALDDGITGTKAQKGISNISTGLLQLSKSANVTDSSFKTTASSISKGLSDVASQVGMTSKEFASLNEKMLRNQAYQQAQTALKGIANAAGLSAKETKNMAQQMGYSATQATEMANKIHKVRDAGNATITMFSKFATAAAVAFATHELINFAKQIKDVGVAFDSLTRSYEAIMGSQRLADAEMKFVNETAKKLGLSLVSLEDNYKGIKAASAGTVLEGESTRKIFEAVAKASAVLGLSSDSTTGALRALEQMMSKGNVQAEELRGQLGERLPGAFNMAAEAMGVTTSELGDMLQRGEVLAADLLPKLADVLENRYGAAAQSAGESSRAAFENFNTAVLELKRTLGESGILEFLAKVTINATNMINVVRGAIASVNTEKAKTAISEYDTALEKANANLTQFKSLWGNTRGLVPENLKSQFDSLSGAVETLETARDKLAKGLQNEQGMVSTFDKATSEASKAAAAAAALEEKLRKEYAKTTDYRLAEAKKELAAYVKIEGAKPEYVAMLKDEISSLEKKANATSISEHKKVTASHNKELKEQVRALEQAKEEQKRALESFNEDYKKATLSTFEYEVEKLDEMYKEREKLVKAGLITEWQLQEWYADKYDTLYQADVESYYDAQEQKIAAQKKIQEEQARLEQEAADEAKRISDEAKEKQQDAYDELYDGIYGFTRNVIDDWDDMGDTLVDMAEDMVKDIIAAFVTQKIAIPIYMYAADMAGISTGLASGMSPSSGGFASMTSLTSSLFTIGKTSYTLVTEGVSAAVSDLVGADLLGSISSAMFGETAAASGFSTAALSTGSFADAALSSGSFADAALSGTAYGSGGASTSLSGASSGIGAAGAVGLAAAAFMAIDTFLGSHDQAEPVIYVQSPIGGMTESTAAYSVSNRDAVTTEIVDIFDAAFASLDEVLDADIVDAVTSNAFRGKVRLGALEEGGENALIDSLVKSAFSYDYTDVADKTLDGLFGVEGMMNPSVKVDGEYVDYWNNTITSFTKDIAGNYSKSLSDILMEAIGLDSGIFDLDFLESIQADGENLLDTFAKFAIIVQETDGFVENITRQMDEFGFTVEEAFTNILVVLSVLDEIQASVDALATTSSVAALNTLTESWYALIESLEAAYATTTQITEAETAMAQVLGANITGLTADALQSALSGGGDIESILHTSIQNAAYADIAQKIAEEYISGINEQIGQVWIDTGGDLEAVAEAMRDIDTTEAQAALEELQESFGLLSESAIDATSDLSEASRIVSLAINGQLSAAQQFAEWQIENAEALSLYNDMTAASVTKKELEGAIDAFVDLGLAGDDLNTVIQDLADRFTDTTDQMLSNISDIESAQGNLTGDNSTSYINDIKSVFAYFQNIPSMAQIRGDETITKEVFNEDAYNKAIAQYVVNSEFQRILGHGPSGDYWVEELLSGGVSIDSLADSIVGGIDNNADIVNEIFNRLFGRSPSSTYWADALSDGLVTMANIEKEILTNASDADLSYYNENGGTTNKTSWGSFENAAQIAGILKSDYTYTQSMTMGGEYSTSKEEVMEAIDLLESLQDVVSNDKINNSALTTFVNTLSSIDASVLEDIFGSDAAEQINKLAGAVDDYESSLSSAKSTTKSTSNEIEVLDDYLDTYLDYLETEIDLRQSAYDEAKSVLEDYISDEEALIDARKGASKSIDDYINSLKGSSSAPVQSMEFFEKRYAQLLSEAKTAEPEDVGEAVSTLTSFASSYLDFAASFGGDYAALFDSIVSDLEQVGSYQTAQAYVENVALGGVKTRVGSSDETLFNLNEAIRDFVNAQNAVDSGSWMTEELATLGNIDYNISQLYEAQKAYYDSINADIPEEYKQPFAEKVISMGTLIGNIQGEDWYDLGGASIKKSDIPLYADAIAEYLGLDKSEYQFANGGIISGPMSGYELPGTTFHGTEAIIPLSSGSIPVTIQGGNDVQDIKIIVKIGDKEIKDITTEVIRTNPRAQHYIKRAANG